jgi:small subunit ribosomal protein S5e
MCVDSEVKQDSGVQYATDVKLFGRWSYEGVESKDISLMAYLNVKTIKAQVFHPFTAGRYQRRSFNKVNCPIVERLLNSLMMKGRNNGKKQLAVRIVKQALELIHLTTGENPLQILIDAISNGGAREDSTRIGSGGVVRRQAVDVSPLRRVNQAIYLITRGSRESSFRNIKSLSEILADEIIAASKGSGTGTNSYAVRKKDEIERVAKGNR